VLGAQFLDESVVLGREMGEVRLRGLAAIIGADLLGLGAIVEGWEGVVGAQIAGHATPIRLLDGVLTVAVDQPAWATQLRLHAGELREPLAALGRCPIDQLEVVVRAR
jgi:hypothetical protein